MKLKIALLLVFFSVCSQSQIKEITPEFSSKIEINARFFVGYDKFDFLYFIQNNTLFKSKNGVSLDYKNVALGQITKVDLLNPLKVLVFYERFNTVVTLDNQLNETLKINFSELKTPLIVTKMGMASQNQLWVFDEITSQLYLYETGNGTIKAVGTPISTEIQYYNSDFNTFEWLDKNNNWYQCSIFGKVEKLNYIFDFDSILFSNEAFIFFRKHEKVLLFNKKSSEIISLKNSDKTFESLTYKNQILTIFTTQGISNYKITLP